MQIRDRDKQTAVLSGRKAPPPYRPPAYEIRQATNTDYYAKVSCFYFDLLQLGLVHLLFPILLGFLFSSSFVSKLQGNFYISLANCHILYCRSSSSVRC